MKTAKSIISVILTLAIVAGVFGCYTAYSSAAGKNMIGDANSDGALNSFDALMIIRYATGTETLSSAELTAADVDKSGSVNSTDALYILHFVVGKISVFPAGNPRAEDGARRLIFGSFWYDPVTGAVTNLDGSGLLGFSYDANDNAFYASLNAWQRTFGYSYIYDYAAPLVVIWYDTSRIFFDYDGKEWMVQMWKGQYGWVLVGCEIGLYYRDFKNANTLVDSKGRKFYKCAEDDMLIKMSLNLYRDGKLLFSRHQQYSWWLTGFVPGTLNSFGIEYDTPQALTVDSKLVFADEEMMDAFIEGLKKVDHVEHNATKKQRPISFKLNDNSAPNHYSVNRAEHSVSLTWN